jgi:hypothetical protein
MRAKPRRFTLKPLRDNALAWYPRLQHGTAKERQNFEVGSVGIHWPDLDEDISYRGLLLGRKSGESPESFKFWLDAKRKGKTATLTEFVNSRRKNGAAVKSSGRGARPADKRK